MDRVGSLQRKAPLQSLPRISLVSTQSHGHAAGWLQGLLGNVVSNSTPSCRGPVRLAGWMLGAEDDGHMPDSHICQCQLPPL